MAINPAAGFGHGEPEVMMDINTTPLIDVMLVLIIMLIITIPVQLHAVNLNLPVGQPPPPPAPPVVIAVDIDAEGTVFWNAERIPDRRALELRMQQVAAAPDAPELHIRPDRQVRYGAVATVLATAQRSGVSKL